MVIIKLQGGLGNQMFQYAIACILGEKNEVPVLLDKSFFDLKEKKPGHTPRRFELNIFEVVNPEPTKADLKTFFEPSLINKFRKFFGVSSPMMYFDPSLNFHPEVLNLKSPVFLRGYFQSYKYYQDHEIFVKDIFKFPVEQLDEKNKEILRKISNSTTVSIHVRRGDYVNDKATKEFHGNCDVNYYLNALRLIASENNNLSLVLFSDDSKWVKEKLSHLPYPKIFIDHNKDAESWKDMFLMSCCNHNIIANSSFSWWAAWLNENLGKTVIAPRQWFANRETKDLIPSEWIQI